MTAQPRPRVPRPQAVLEVVETSRVTPQLIRVVLGGDQISMLRDNEFTDKYVKLLLADPASGLEPPYDLDAIRASTPELLPVRRTYTVRSWDHEAGTITLDVVLHGPADDPADVGGVAARWAASARPGDRIALTGAGGGYAPDAGTAYHLLIGDLSALPAIAAALESMVEDAEGTALIQLDDADDRIQVDQPSGVEVRWIIGDRQQLVEQLRGLDPIPDGAQVFAHGERGVIKAIRRELVKERGVPKDAISISAYWAMGRIEDQFQAEKREPIGSIED